MTSVLDSFSTLNNWYLSGVEKPTRLQIWRYIWNNSLHWSTSHFSQNTTTSSFVKVPKYCPKCGIKGALSSPANLRSCCRSSGIPIGSRWPHAEILPLAGLSWPSGERSLTPHRYHPKESMKQYGKIQKSCWTKTICCYILELVLMWSYVYSMNS